MLLASGRSPTEIAAVTFTEAAASELRQRVEDFVADVLRGTTPMQLHLYGRTDRQSRNVSRCQREPPNLMPLCAPRSMVFAVCC